MQISRKDVIWNYVATSFKIGSSLIILPFILRFLPSETVGIWTVYLTIATFSYLLDFGFNPTFTRNVTYVLSGVRKLKEKGYEILSEENNSIDFSLLKGLIESMKWIYLRLSIILFFILLTFGTYYIHTLMQKYSGDRIEVYISWFLLIVINSFYIYSLYYESLLLGKGLIKKSKQIVVLGQSAYMITAIILILKGFGLIAIVSAQAVSVIINRWLSYLAFFTPEIENHLRNASCPPIKNILKAIYPNAAKIGLTSFGGFLIQRSSLVIGSLYLSLDQIASYGITMQILTILSGLAAIYINTYQPRITYLHIINRKNEIKRLYITGEIFITATFLIGGIVLLLFGQQVLYIIKSQTKLMSIGITLTALILTLEQTNMIVAGSMLLAKNEVPFFKASIISGIVIFLGLIFCFEFMNMGLLTLIIVPLIVDISYQSWKWPGMVIRDLNIAISDIRYTICDLTKRLILK